MKAASAPEPGGSEPARVDVWLWAVRLYKTRSLAAEACRKGQVAVNGQRVKPARSLRPGDELSVTRGDLVLTVAVRATLTRRVGAKEVPAYLEDRTSEEARAAAAAARQQAREGTFDRDEGAGRPTKRERREMEDILAEAEDRQAFLTAMQKATRSRFLLGLLGTLLIGGATPLPAADPPRRSFEPSEKSLTFQISDSLSVSAEKLAPATDPATGAMTGLAASGRVIIKAKPNGAADFIVVSCDQATYRADGDVIVLTGWPAVKSGMQILRATAAETFVRVARASGKWEIKGPHQIELSFGKKK